MQVSIPPATPRGLEVTGWCLGPHDVVLAKCVAGRERDWEFAADAIGAGVVDPAELLARARDLPVAEEERDRIVRALEGILRA